MMFAAGFYVGAMYVIGYQFFKPNSLGSTLAFLGSPVTVPLGIAILAIVY